MSQASYQIKLAQFDPNIAKQLGNIMAIGDMLGDTDTIGPEQKINLLLVKDGKSFKLVKIDPGESQLMNVDPNGEIYSLFNECVSGIERKNPAIAQFCYYGNVGTKKAHEALKDNRYHPWR